MTEQTVSGYRKRNQRHILRQKGGQKKREHKTDDQRAEKIIGAVFMVLQQKFPHGRVAPQGDEHEDIQKHTADQNKGYPIILLRNSNQLKFFAKLKIKLQYDFIIPKLNSSSIRAKLLNTER